MTIHQQIKEARERRQWSMERLAKEISEAEGLAKPLAWQTVQQWENGASAPKRTRMETVKRLLDIAEVEPWAEYQPVRPGKFNFVVVVGQGSGGDLPERIWTDGDYPAGATNEYAEVISTDPHAFIIRVVGSSMVPKYTPGDFALVEPGTEPDLEDDVLVRLANGQTMIKRLLSRRGAHLRLGSYNDTEVLVFDKEQVTWMYYVAYPVPARKIKTRV